MKFNWVETELTGKEFAIADITNNGNKEGQVIVIRSAKEDSIQVNVRHHVYSYNKAVGLPHLLEHCIFGTVWNGKPMFEAMSELANMGIDLNAGTSIKDICVQMDVSKCMDENKYKNDAVYQKMAESSRYTDIFNNLAQICKNLYVNKISEEYFNKEKSIVSSELEQRHPGDKQNIKKFTVPLCLYGDKVSAIGSRWNILNIPYEFINYARTRVFSKENLKTIEIIMPNFVSLEDLENLFLNPLFDALESNSKESRTMTVSKEVKEIVDENMMIRYAPSSKSFQMESIGFNNHFKRGQVFTPKFKKAFNTVPVRGVIINVPTTKYDINSILSVDDIACQLAINFINNELNRFYREKYPYSYGVSMMTTAWRHKKNYGARSFILELNDGVSQEDFLNSIKEFNDYVTGDAGSYNKRLTEARRIHIENFKKQWHSYNMSEFAGMRTDLIVQILFGSYADSAEEKIAVLNSLKAEDGMLFPKVITDSYNESKVTLALIDEYVKKIIDGWKINMLFSENVIEDNEEPKKEPKKEFKKEFKKDFKSGDKKPYKKNDKPYKKK